MQFFAVNGTLRVPGPIGLVTVTITLLSAASADIILNHLIITQNLIISRDQSYHDHEAPCYAPMYVEQVLKYNCVCSCLGVVPSLPDGLSSIFVI